MSMSYLIGRRRFVGAAAVAARRGGVLCGMGKVVTFTTFPGV
jgi:hypothetical protein